MQINKCDICKKILEEETVGVSVLGKKFQRFDICPKCAEPVMKFLKTKKLITPPKK